MGLKKQKNTVIYSKITVFGTPSKEGVQQELLDRHYLSKRGKYSYYGQG